MTADDFNDWRRRMGFTLGEAAEALGVTQRTAEYYSAGRAIPLVIELACEALEGRYNRRPEGEDRCP